MELTAALSARPEPTALTPEEVAAMLDTLAAADMYLTIAGLEDVLAMLRPAAAIRPRLAAVPAETLQAALQLRAQRAAGPAEETRR